ncbi:hypothetical protein HMPREF1861_01252 [Corynebacterium kroppenstedtii]|nr:hypothetical protein HMPREF1861_01252 [Corynebacterium kroppenstedtii]
MDGDGTADRVPRAVRSRGSGGRWGAGKKVMGSRAFVSDQTWL